jgi:hypothetical protein
LERAAWRLWRRSSRRFFLTVTIVVAAVIVLSSVIAAVVAATNGAAVAEARGRGQRVASAMAEFQDHLGQANDQFGDALVVGEEQTPGSRARYDAELLASSSALTRAGLDATGDDAEAVRSLAVGLDEYARLVVTARAYPSGTRFYRDARATVADELSPDSDAVRLDAEAHLSGQAGEVEGPRTTVAAVGLLIALAAVLGATALVAGRTRIRLHPAFVAAAVLLAVQLAVVAHGLRTERDELSTAAGTEFVAYREAQGAAASLFDMRAAELDAVARIGDVDDDYADFQAGVRSVAADRSPAGSTPADADTLPEAVRDYAESVEEVRALADRDLAAGAGATVDGRSAIEYRTARGLAASLVNRTTADLQARLDRAAEAGVAWPLPLLLGGAAAVLAAVGVLRRGQAYVWGSA